MKVTKATFDASRYRPLSAPKRYNDQYQYVPSHNRSKYTQQRPILRGWGNDSKQKEFEELNQYNDEGISRVRKLVDNHSHAFDLEEGVRYPNQMRVVVNPEYQCEGRKRYVDQYGERRVKFSGESREDEKQLRTGRQTEDYGVQVDQQDVGDNRETNKKKSCRCTRCGHGLRLKQ